MKYLIKVHASIERGNVIEESGGPGPLFSYISERLHPEAAYGTPTSRTCWFVADVDDPSVLAEVMLVATRETGNEPSFTPVYTLKEFGGIVSRALGGVAKAPRIG